MKILTPLAAAAAIALFATGASAQSAKFDATWSNDLRMLEATIATGVAAACLVDGALTAIDPCILAEETVATLDVAQQKDLLIGVSAQIGLVTLTQAKGKNRKKYCQDLERPPENIKHFSRL